MCTITCGECGAENLFEMWLETISGMIMPKDVFQCPACKVSIKKTFGTPKILRTEDGDLERVIPGEVSLVRVPARL
ncbi:MAG: hypothetical protein KKH22_06635 [Proteobacteria bacterium]|nr:hypothetical protein [Pseudomonadota bacterium]